MKYDTLTYYYTNTNRIELIYSKHSTLSYPEHNHISMYTIGLVMDGSFLLKQNNISSNYVKDDFFLISPYTPHTLQAGELGYSLITICINKDFIRTSSLGEVYANLMKIMDTFFLEHSLPKKQLLSFFGILNLLYSNENNAFSHDNIILKKVGIQIETNPEQEINLDTLSNEIFLSKYHFTREFKKEYGLPPHKFQMQNRIRKAQHLLRQGNNITKVALDTGFYDQSHFIRHFKKIMGITPSEYRIACKNAKSTD